MAETRTVIDSVETTISMDEQEQSSHHINLAIEKCVVPNIFANEEIKIESLSDSDCTDVSTFQEVEFIKVEAQSPIPEQNIDEIVMDKSRPKKQNNRKNVIKPTVDLKSRYECDFCGKFLSKWTLWRHRTVVHKVRGELCCKTCAKVFPTDEELASHRISCLLRKKNLEYNKPSKFECDICKAVLTTKSSLLTHMKSKHIPEGKQYKCEFCNAEYVVRSNLQQHLDLKHLNVRNFICSMCGKMFKRKFEVEIHLLRHNGEKRFECSFDGCIRRFTSINNRDTHMRVHTGEKPFQCTADGCGRQFRYMIDFKRHKFKKHGIFTKMFPCTLCDEILPENSLLRKHMQTHGV